MRYRERLSVPLWWWLPGLGLAALIALEFNQGVRVLPDWVAYAVLLPVAAVALGAGKKLEVMEVNLDGPKEGEVMVEIKATALVG